MKKIPTIQHTDTDAHTAPHNNMRKRFGSVLVAGCLSLSMCPALAFAATAQQDSQVPPNGQEGNPPAMQPIDQDNQQALVPSGFDANPMDMDQMPESNDEAPADMGQMPENVGEAPADMGQMPESDDEMPAGMSDAPNDKMGMLGEPSNQRNDALSDQIQQLISDEYGIALPDFNENEEGSQANGTEGFQPGNPGEAPELADGQVNIQAVIDAVRDVLRTYSAEDLETKIGDADFISELQEYIQSSSEKRTEMFAGGELPSLSKLDEANSVGSEPPALPEGTEAPDMNGAAPEMDIDDELLGSLVELASEALGNSSEA